MLTSSQWASYRNIINQASEGFNKDQITWHRFIRNLPRYGEEGSDRYEDIVLNCLISYNIFRTWPMTKETTSGSIDKENIVVIINKDYLSNLGYLNTNGFLQMDPGKDTFIHRGIKYRAAGETEVSQAGDDPLMFYIVLSREQSNTGDNKY